MLYQASILWDNDREQWKNEFGDETYDQFYARHSKSPCTDNWGGGSEIGLFSKEYEGLEIRQIMARPSDGAKPTITSTAADGQVISKVAFVVWNGGHFDIGAAKAWTGQLEATGVNKVVFNPAEADRVQPLLLEHIAGRKAPSSSAPQQRPQPNQHTQQSKEDFLKQAQKDMMNDGDVDWTVVETEDRRQRQARKKKEKEKREQEEKERKEKEEKEKKEKENEARQTTLLAQQALMLRTAQEQAVRVQQALQGQHAQQASTLMTQQHHPHQQPVWNIPQQTQQHFQQHFGPASYAQALQQAHPPPKPAPAPSGEFDILLGGSPVLPAVVIFTKETVPRVEAMMRKVAPAAASLVKSAVKRGTGTNGERCELHCLQNDVATVQAAVGVLRTSGVRADIFKSQQYSRNAPGALATQATAGMEEAIRRAGVCRQYYYGQTCTRSPCKFKCWGSHVPQYPASPC